MRRLKVTILVGVILSGLLFLTGCVERSENTSNQNGISDDIFLDMEDKESLSYEVPRSTPGILIDQLGYEPDSTKIVQFEGKNIPEFFEVVDSDSLKTVYKAKVEIKAYSEEYGENIAEGDFSELKTEGSYFIRADYLGESYIFEIAENIYGKLFNNAQKTYFYNRCGITVTDELSDGNGHNACHLEKSILREDMTVSIDVSGGWHQDSSGSKNVETAAQTIGTLLLAYEIFPDMFSDNVGIPESGNDVPDILDEVKYEIDWLLKMQNPETGAVYSGVTVQDKSNKQISYVEKSSIESTQAFAYVLAKFSFLYQKYDVNYATNCLKMADIAWRYSVVNESDKNIIYWKAAAAAELYRASGMQGYRDYLNQYFSENIYSSESSYIDFLTSVTYLNTQKSIDKNVCEEIMKAIMKETENISAKSRTSVFGVPFNKDQSNNDELLSQMVIMSFVDYVISNHEYDVVLYNYLHYFLGRNPNGISYIDGERFGSHMAVTDSLGIMKRFDKDAEFIFMLSKILGRGYSY